MLIALDVNKTISHSVMLELNSLVSVERRALKVRNGLFERKVSTSQPLENNNFVRSSITHLTYRTKSERLVEP